MSSCSLEKLWGTSEAAWGRIIWGAFCLLGSALAAHVIPYDGTRIITLANVAATVFSILFGFSMTVIAVIGALDSVLSRYSWQILQRYQKTFGAKVLRQCLLCLTYFCVTLLALVIVALVPDTCLHRVLSRGFIFLVTLAFLLSFAMPFSLYGLYMERFRLLMVQKGAPQ